MGVWVVLQAEALLLLLPACVDHDGGADGVGGATAVLRASAAATAPVVAPGEVPAGRGA